MWHINKKKKKAGSQSKPRRLSFPIVGLGASAGGLEALGQILPRLPPNSDMAFIIIQHLHPTHESMTVAILGRKTRLPVEEIKDNTQVQPNHVYVIPPNAN